MSNHEDKTDRSLTGSHFDSFFSAVGREMSEAQRFSFYKDINKIRAKSKTPADYEDGSKSRYAIARNGVQDFIDRQELKDAGNCDLINYDLS